MLIFNVTMLPSDCDQGLAVALLCAIIWTRIFHDAPVLADGNRLSVCDPHREQDSYGINQQDAIPTRRALGHLECSPGTRSICAT